MQDMEEAELPASASRFKAPRIVSCSTLALAVAVLEERYIHTYTHAYMCTCVYVHIYITYISIFSILYTGCYYKLFTIHPKP